MFGGGMQGICGGRHQVGRLRTDLCGPYSSLRGSTWLQAFKYRKGVRVAQNRRNTVQLAPRS